MKKMVVLALLIQLCLVSAMAEEYSFTLTPSGEGENYRYTVTYDTASKKFSLEKEKIEGGGLLMALFFGSYEEPEEPVVIYKDLPNVEIYRSSSSKNWGGNANELIFMNKSGDFLFGGYIDPVKFDTDDRRKSYLLVKGDKGVEKKQGYAVLKFDYVPYDELLSLAKPIGGSSASTGKTSAGKGKTASGKSSTGKATTALKSGNRSYGSPTSSILRNYNLTLWEAITRFMGKVGYDELINKDWQASFDLVKGSFGVIPYCWTKSDDMSKYFIYNCRNCNLLGQPLSSANIYQKEGSKHIHWEYSLDFKAESVAEDFLGKVRKEMEGTGIPLKHSSKNSYSWVTDDYALKVNAYFKKIGDVYSFTIYVYQNDYVKF